MFCRILTLLIGCSFAFAGEAGGVGVNSALLQQTVENWLGERDHWAFTQRAIEYEGDVPHERLERYDPSRPGDARWELLAIDGKQPTAEQRQKWAEKKFKRHHRRIDVSLGDFFDFDSARVIAETPKLVRYDVPLKNDKRWLFPVDKVSVRVTINKQTRALEHLTAYVRAPFRVLLGAARITDGTLDLDFLHFSAPSPSPAAAQPTGTARVSVLKLGERVDFTWSNFKRVMPARETAQLEKPAGNVLLDPAIEEP